MNDLERSILKTVAFFDVFKYPLTSTEIWKYLLLHRKKVNLLEIRKELNNSSILKNELSLKEGFYCLKGNEHIYLIRKQNNNLAERKFYKAIRLIKLYRFIPFVKMVAVCNSLAHSNARETSDIDFFVITKKNNIWLARFFSILFVYILGQRPSDKDRSDTFCLSFFIDEESLNIQKIMLSDKDIYSPFWIQTLLPIYNQDNLYERFLKSNQWYLDYMSNAYANDFTKEVKDNFFTKILSKIFGFLVSPPFLNKWTDHFYRLIQVKIIDKNLKSLVNLDTRVIINDEMLKFHDNDRRDYFYRRWKERINNILNKKYEQTF